MISFPIQIAVNWGLFHMSGQTLIVISEQVTLIIINHLQSFTNKIANKASIYGYLWFIYKKYIQNLALSAGAERELRPRGLQQVVDHHWGARQAGNCGSLAWDFHGIFIIFWWMKKDDHQHHFFLCFLLV